MKKKKIMFIILCMLTVLAAGTAHATEKERVDPLQPAIAEKILRFHVLANSDAKDDQNVKLKVRDAVGHMLGQKLKKVTDRICVFRDRYMRLWMNLPVRSCVKF